MGFPLMQTQIASGFTKQAALQHYEAGQFPIVAPPPPHDWLRSHFAVGGWSPLQRLSGMLTAHMTQIAPHNGFTWHPHRGLEIYTWVLEGTLYHEDTTGGKGEIQKGELQRMFSGDYIEHQELNRTSEYARVIQIWFIAGREHRGIPAHYQQVASADLPARAMGDATVYHLIGDGSPMEQHVNARLTATTVRPGGVTPIERPRHDEDLFLYVTDGTGHVRYDMQTSELGQYDVILGTDDMTEAHLHADADAPLELMSFYLPKFL